MSWLERFRRSPRWLMPLVLLVGLAALVVSSAALAPHDEGEDRSCLVCKAGHEPLPEPTTRIELEPTSAVSTPMGREARCATNRVSDSTPPRAPPA